MRIHCDSTHFSPDAGGMEWPNGGEDRFLLGGSETSMGCQGELGTFVVWDTTAVRDQLADPDYVPPA